MRKLAIILITLAFFAAACGDGEDAFGPNPNVAAGTLEEITVTDHGAVSPAYTSTSVTIDSGRGIEITIEEHENFDVVSDSCTVTAEITESDYEAVLAAFAVADLANYVPLSEDECQVIVGTQGYSIGYRTVEGGVYNIHTGFCPLDEEIEELISLVMSLGGRHFAECSDDDGTDDGDDGEDDSDVTIYRVPVINPNDLPRPRRVF